MKEKKPYCITLNTNVVDETKEKIKPYGGELNGIIETLLIKYNNGEIKI